jgi:hypothetical protein
VPSRARLSGPGGVDDELAVDGVADVSLQRADGVLLGLAIGELALEIDAPVGAGLADLTDRREVQGVVEAPVLSLGDTVHDSAAR